MEDWVGQAAGLRQWRRNGERAPHKPLLLLYALGRFQADGGEPLRYTAVEADLRRLLADYGPPRPTSPGYPFHHLAGDGVWEVRTASGPGSPGSQVGALRSSAAAGQLAPDLRAALRREPALLGRMARTLLDRHFPPSLHEELCEAVGIQIEASDAGPAAAVQRRLRDRALRERVLTAYEYQCAFCGYDGRLGTVTVGLDAAHVRWWAMDGPDEIDNGLCLCALHHKLFDKGVLGLDEGRRIIVSQRFVGRGRAAREQVIALAGRPLLGPQPGMPDVADEHRAWHVRQVFHGAPRAVTAADG